MARQHGYALGSILLLLTAVACEPPPTEELLNITFGSGSKAPPVELDLDCNNGGCLGLVEVEAELSFEPHEYSTYEASVEILQYKVEFLLDPPHHTLEVPFFAGRTSVIVGIGSSATFNVVVAGDNQRSYLLPRFPGQEMAGRATLTLAGYDQDNAQVQPTAEFDIFFDDYTVGVLR